MTTPILQVDGLRKVFRKRRFRKPDLEFCAVDDVSFALEKGRTLALVGESGAGKSTTGRLVLRLIEPDAGSVLVDGVDVLQLSRREFHSYRRRLQMIFQDPYGAVDPRVTIGRSVAEPLLVHFGMNRTDRERRALELLRRVGLDAHHLHRMPHELSGGQLQRVSIARALAVDPDLIVCDEAVAALDVSIRGQILNLLLDIQEEHELSYLFVAHDLGMVEAIADDVVVMRRGRIMEHGSTEQVFRAPTSTYTAELLAAIPRPSFERVDVPDRGTPGELGGRSRDTSIHPIG